MSAGIDRKNVNEPEAKSRSSAVNHLATTEMILTTGSTNSRIEVSSFQKCFISKNKNNSDTIWFNLHYLFLCIFVFECGALADIVMSPFSNSIGYEDFWRSITRLNVFDQI